MSTGQSAVTLCGQEIKAGIVHSTCGQTCGCKVKLCDPSLTSAIPERLRDELLVIKRYTNRHFTLLWRSFPSYTSRCTLDWDPKENLWG